MEIFIKKIKLANIINKAELKQYYKRPYIEDICIFTEADAFIVWSYIVIYVVIYAVIFHAMIIFLLFPFSMLLLLLPQPLKIQLP